ncbi:ABC transporter permease [Actinopolymorpha rutila]|uniref:ABC-2 type transport system permease protein n=1 Tax=Actinopolymorpha rutila TaxID=446787 RepID=A0A852Z7X0_9ACTN|nr:ABC transporter permease [Actinopolymorpha rutila]NYH89357.1 ABC-2 type transport system permease protein [Actinopolymorpha rutila]
MSAAEPIVGRASARPHRRVSPRFFWSELTLLFGRRRNWVGMAVLAAVPLIIAISVKLSSPSSGGGGGEDGPNFFAGITSNGLFVALAALTVELPLFLPLAVSAIAGDAVAGEANLGTLRGLLAVPVERTRLLAVKYAGIVVFAFACTVLVAVVGAVAGLILFGGGPMLLLSGVQVGFAEGLGRLLLVCGYIAVCLSTLGAIGLFVSTLTEQPIGATIATVILSLISHILDVIPQLDWLHPYLLTHYWTGFGDLLRSPIAIESVTPGLWLSLAYIAVFLAAAWARFAGRDVTS